MLWNSNHTVLVCDTFHTRLLHDKCFIDVKMLPQRHGRVSCVFGRLGRFLILELLV